MQLSEKYRPQTWGDFKGQDRAIARIKAVLSLPSFDRGAFLLQGPSASGKTSAGYVIASQLGCADTMSLSEIKGQDCDVASLRKLSDWFSYVSPTASGFKVAIVNECHNMSQAARAYALELMEAPPAKRVIILTTTETDWADETLFSRFYRIQFAKPHSEAIVEHLERVAQREGFDVAGLNLKRFVQERHNNIRLCLLDLEIEAAVTRAESQPIAA